MSSKPNPVVLIRHFLVWSTIALVIISLAWLGFGKEVAEATTVVGLMIGCVGLAMGWHSDRVISTSPDLSTDVVIRLWAVMMAVRFLAVAATWFGAVYVLKYEPNRVGWALIAWYIPLMIAESTMFARQCTARRNRSLDSAEGLETC